MDQSNAFRILIVDDDQDICELMTRKFRKAGWETFSCGDGSEGLDALAAEKFDAVITDLNMPMLNGTELVARAKRESLNRSVNIFVMSGAADPESVKRLAQLGIAEIVAKPFNVDALVQRLQEALQANDKRRLPKQQVLDGFFKGATEVLNHYVPKDYQLGTLDAKNSTSYSGDVSATISFSGTGLVGFTTLLLAQSFVDELEEKLFGSINCDIDNAMIADLVGEMVNQMIGAAQVQLRPLGVELTQGLPNVIVGPGHTLFQRSRIPIAAVPITGNGQHIAFFEVCVTASRPPS